MSVDPSNTSASVEHVEGIQAAARWILGTAGAVATVLLAGFQIKDLSITVESGLQWRAGLLALLSVTTVAVALDVFRLAARVLVPDRITADDLVRAEQGQVAAAQGIHVRKGKDGGRETLGLTQDLVDSVHLARGWLLPEGCASVGDLMESIRKAPVENRMVLLGSLREVLVFCRMEIARRRYRQLVGAMAGPRGWLFIVSLAGLAIVSASQVENSPPIDEPLRMNVTFVKTSDSANEAGPCAGLTVEGTAVGGSLARPLVGFNSGTCRGQFTISEDVGVAIPITEGR